MKQSSRKCLQVYTGENAGLMNQTMSIGDLSRTSSWSASKIRNTRILSWSILNWKWSTRETSYPHNLWIPCATRVAHPQRIAASRAFFTCAKKSSMSMNLKIDNCYVAKRQRTLSSTIYWNKKYILSNLIKYLLVIKFLIVIIYVTHELSFGYSIP